MAMSSKFQAVNQKDTEFELTVRMTLGEWNRLKTTLDDAKRDYPAWRLADVIRKMIIDANAHWEGVHVDE